MGANPYTRYQKAQVETADQGKLLLMLYEGALRFLERARQALQENNGEKTNNNLVRAQEIIAELMASLNLEAGEVAVSLFRLYEYMHFLLVQANVKKDAGPLDEAEGMLRQLKDTWSGVLETGASPGNPGEVAATASTASPEGEGRQPPKGSPFADYQLGRQEEDALKQGARRVDISG